MLTIADAKRGDIGSTMAGYADAWLRDGSALAADSVTLSPYLGFESLRPALDLAAANGRGVFVLALTSNPEGASRAACGWSRIRGQAHCAGGRRRKPALRRRSPWAQWAWWLAPPLATPWWIWALTWPPSTGPILAPGLGAQGATGADMRATFGAAYPAVLATSSRGILAAGPDVAGLRAATVETLQGL